MSSIFLAIICQVENNELSLMAKLRNTFQLNQVSLKVPCLVHRFFLIYDNDLEIGIKSKVKFFADDTMIYSVVHNPTLTASVLNHDL